MRMGLLKASIYAPWHRFIRRIAEQTMPSGRGGVSARRYQNSPALQIDILGSMNATLNAYKSISSRSFIRITAIIFAIFGVLMFLARAKAGLHLFEFGDEAEKFVAAQMMKNGMILYRDIFAHHGPILYIISHAYVNLVDPADFSHIRWFMVGLALLSSFSIYTSP